MKRTLAVSMLAFGVTLGTNCVHALPPSSFNPATTTILYVSGSEAVDPQIEGMMRRLCLIGTLDTYIGTSQAAHFCTVDPARVPGLVKPNVVLYKTSAGGNAGGVGPVAKATTMSFFDLALIAANPALCAGPVNFPSEVAIAPDLIGLPAFARRTCSTAGGIVNAVPEVGVTDLEPVVVNAALPVATPAQLATLVTQGTHVRTFGVAVTKGLRDALQAQQGLLVGSETLGNMPSIPYPVIGNIFFTGGTWTTALGVKNFADDNVYIARRADESGEQLSGWVYFLGGPFTSTGCSGFLPPLLPNTTTCNPVGGAGPEIFQGLTVASVTSCLNTHNTMGRWAIAWLGLNASDCGGLGSGFRFVSVTGRSPRLLQVVNGFYGDFMEATIQWRAGSLAGDDLSFANAFAQLLGEPPLVQRLNIGYCHDWAAVPGSTGLLALPERYPLSDPYSTDAAIAANPANVFTRAPLGNTNNCILPLPAGLLDLAIPAP